MSAAEDAKAALAVLEFHPWIDDATCSWIKVDRREAVQIRNALRALLDEVTQEPEVKK